MADQVVTRRHVLKAIGLFAVVTPVLAACGGGSTGGSGTAAPSGGSASAPTAAATSAPAAQANPASGNVSLSISVYPDRPWMKTKAQEWADKNGVRLRVDDIAYADMNTKQLTELATGTMQDVVFSGNKWIRYTAFKGAFRPIDDYVKTKPYDKDDIIPSAITGGTFEGKLYGLPYEWNPGNINVVMYNKDMVQQKGVNEPTDSWTHDQFTEWAAKMTDSAKGVYGTDLWPGTYYDFGDLVRDYGGDVMSDDGKKFLFGTDPLNRQIAQWVTELRTKLKVAPPRAMMSQEQIFPSGKVASTCTNAVSVKSTIKQIGNKFKWGVVLGPTGPEGLRGYDSFAALWSIYIKSKFPEQAYDLILYLTSRDTALYALMKDGQVPARISVWRDPEANKETDIFKRVADWISDGKSKGPFPIPDNLRYTELETAFENNAFPMFYGEVDFATGLQKTQEACQKVMDQPRG
ncbi:MAG: extracellular solute-binding protein [Chloroflexi bacterium]|nr:extracellular solute-binding protein [Chloroflexota bacterium]